MSRAVKTALSRVEAMRQKIRGAEDNNKSKAATDKRMGAWTLSQRQENAAQRFVDYVVESIGASPEDARKLLAAYVKHKMVKLNTSTGQFDAKHGSLLSKSTLKRALANLSAKASVSAGSMDALKALLKEWKDVDLKLDKTHGGGYLPSEGVLAQRERHRQKEEIDEIGKGLFKSQFASEWEGNKGVWVTYRDNRNREKYEEKLAELIQAAEKAGYRTRVRNDVYVILFDQKKVKGMEAAYKGYIAALAKAGSRAARKKLGLPPETVHKSGNDAKPAHKQEAGEITYEVIGLSTNIKVKSKEELVKVLKRAGIKMTGVNQNARQRVELQGQPTFKGLNGPMYNGKNSIRYETPEADKALNKSKGSLTKSQRTVLADLKKHGTITSAMAPHLNMTPEQFLAIGRQPAKVPGMVKAIIADLEKKVSAYGQTAQSRSAKDHVNLGMKGRVKFKTLKKVGRNVDLEIIADHGDSNWVGTNIRVPMATFTKLRDAGAIHARAVSAAKDAGTPKKDKKRQAELSDVIGKAATLREAVSLDAFPEVESACKAVDALEALATGMAEAQIKLKVSKAKTEEAAMAQGALDELRSRVDSMIPPLKATMSAMETLVLAAAALAEKFDAMQMQAEVMETKLKAEKERLAAIAKAVQTTAKMG